MSNLAVSYAAVILADAEVEITADKLLALTKAAGITEFEPILAQIYAKALNKQDLKSLLTAFGSTAPAGAAAASAGGDAGAAAAAEEEAAPAKEEEEEESDMDMGSLF